MASRSLGELVAKIKADASQFVSELMRADNVLRRKATDMDKELGKIGKKFSLPDISKDILRGVGIGSGFAVAQTAAEMISGHWKKAAEEAQAIEKSTATQLELVQQIISRRQSEDERRATAAKNERAAMHEYFDTLAKSANTFESRFISVEGRLGGKMLDLLFGNPTEADVAEMRTKWQKAFDVFDALNLKIEESKKNAAVSNRLTDFFGGLDDQSETMSTSTSEARRKQAEVAAQRIAQINEWRTKVQLDYNAALEKEAAALMDTLATPQEEHAARLRRIETLYQTGKLSAEEYTRALTASFRKLDSEELEAVNKKLKEFFDPLDEQSEKNFKTIEERARAFSSAMANMWDSVGDRAGDAFADMVLTGENAFKKLPEMAARMALNIAARMAIINPLMNAIFGGFGGWNPLPSFFGSGAAPAGGGGKAIGGPVSAGTAYMVGERGREMFVPSVPGTIVTAEKTEQVMGGGNTYIIDARGTDESVVQRLAIALQQLAGPGVIERRALAAVSDRNARMAF